MKIFIALNSINKDVNAKIYKRKELDIGIKNRLTWKYKPKVTLTTKDIMTNRQNNIDLG